MACSDPLLLQRFLDSDLDGSQAELIADHLESCEVCRTDARNAVDLRAFVQEQLGAEDEGEEEATAGAIATIARRVLPPPAPRPDTVRWWRRTWMAAAALIVMALLVVPVFFLPNLTASPEQILDDAAERSRMWLYRPNQSMRWEVDTTSQGVKNIADGRWRTLFWRNNGATSFAEVSRQIDPQGRVEFAYWQQSDGSSVLYRRSANQVEVVPATPVLKEALNDLPEDLRGSLESYLTSRSLRQSLDVERRRDIERLHGRSVWISGGKTTFRRGLLGRFGDVLHITVVKEDSMRPDIVRAVHEYDIDNGSLRLLRLKSTITYTDGTTGVHDSRWVSYREISPAEFAAQRPDDVLSSGIPVSRLTASDLAERYRKELSRK